MENVEVGSRGRSNRNRVFFIRGKGKKMTISGSQDGEELRIFFGRKFPIHPTSTYPGPIRTKTPPLGPWALGPPQQNVTKY